jgi:hypothetical protein
MDDEGARAAEPEIEIHLTHKKKVRPSKSQPQRGPDPEPEIGTPVTVGERCFKRLLIAPGGSAKTKACTASSDYIDNIPINAVAKGRPQGRPAFVLGSHIRNLHQQQSPRSPTSPPHTHVAATLAY